MLDALAAGHDSKYAYWVPRPSQVDPALRPVIGVPNHPSYPSNHSCLSTAAAGVLAHFFPAAAGDLRGTAVEAGVSRIHAGLHTRTDVDAGESIGRAVADAAIARHVAVLDGVARASVARR
jgi:membrane-associated phospholipid phosphatase